MSNQLPEIDNKYHKKAVHILLSLKCPNSSGSPRCVCKQFS